MAQSQNISYHLGSIKIKHFIDADNNRLSNVAYPINQTDAVNKQYVDDIALGNIESAFEAGTGINKIGNVISVNNNLTHVTAIGNINIGSWNADIINVPYGGTGKNNFSSNKLIMGNGTSPLISISELSFESNTFQIACPISILNTSNSIGIGSGGSFTTLGGGSISGNLFIGKSLIVSENITLAGDLTVGNIIINGSTNFGTITSTDSNFTSSTITNLLTTNITSSNIFTTQLKTTNLTSNNIVSSSITNSNFITTNVSTISLLASNISTASIKVNNNINTNNLITTNISSVSLSSTNFTTSNLYTTNLSGSSAILSNINILANLTAPSIVSNSIASVYISSSNLFTQSITSNNLVINSSSRLGNVTATNLITTTFTSSNSLITNITNSNLISTNIINTNITTLNLIGTSIINTNLTSNNINASNITLSNLIGNGVTVNNIYTNNLITSNITSANLYLSGIAITTSFNSSYISSGQLYVSNLSSFNNTHTTNLTSSNFRNTHSTISNINSTNITSLNLYVHNVSNFGSMGSINLSTGNLYSSTTAFFNNSITNTSTISNLKVNNISLTGSISTANINTNTLLAPLISNTSLTTTNLLSTNVNTTNFSTTNIRISGNSNFEIATVNNLTVGTLFVGSNTNLTSLISSNFTVSSILNTYLTTSNLNVQNYANIRGLLNIGSNIDFTPSTYGNILNIAPCILNDISSPESTNIPSWSTSFFGQTTLSAQNNVTIQKASSLYLQGDPIAGINQTFVNSSALTIGYVNNQTGGSMTGQIMFERADGNWYGSIFTEDSTNKLVIANASLSGGGGLGLYTHTGTKITFAEIPNASNFTPNTFLELSNDTSTFYSTTDSTSTTSGALVVNGGLGVTQNITCDTITPNNINASIQSLQDVNSIPPENGQSLVWNGSSWTPTTISASSAPTPINIYPMESVVPEMNSNGPVAGTDGDYYVSASSEYNSTYAAYKCLSSIINPSDWATDNENTNFWITIQLPTPQNIRYVLLEGRINNEDPYYITIQGSNDNSLFTDIIVNESFTALNYDGYFAARIPENSTEYTYYKFLFPSGSGSSPGLNMIRLFRFDNSTYTEGIMDNSSLEGNGKFNSAIINGRWPMAFQINESGTVNIRAQFTCYTSSPYVYRKFVMYIDGSPFSYTGSSFIKQTIHQNLHIPTQTLEWTGSLSEGIHTISFFVDGGSGIIFDTNDTIKVNVIKY
jgi:hypothetical protein